MGCVILHKAYLLHHEICDFILLFLVHGQDNLLKDSCDKLELQVWL